MDKSPVVVLNHLSFSYNDLPVLEDVTLTVSEHDFLCVVGPNAGGKTTLLKVILGFLRPSGGTVHVFGEAPVRVRERMGYVPQNTRLDPEFPVRVIDVVLMGRLGRHRRFGPYSKSDKKAAEEAIRQVEMDELRNRPFSQLSGGQRQRVLIARALTTEPDLLLLDEPTASVDAVIETEFYELLRRLNQRITIILVTHDLGFVSRYVKRVACVNRRVVVHPTSEVTGEMINAIYGRDVKMVRHDHRDREEGHQWLNS
jgi:zinc transport system ATP-binding protein